MKLKKTKNPKSNIIEYFNYLNRKVFKFRELQQIFEEKREEWNISKNATTIEFIDYLQDEAFLKKYEFSLSGRIEKRYVWHDCSPFEMALSLKKDAYLSHFSAMVVHQITEQNPKVIYVNHEQSPKPRSKESLEQERIDNAFKRPPRKTKNLINYKNNKICIINGKYTGQLGIIEIQGTDQKNVKVTNIERTLIDITVRPIYSGGAFEILNAYRLAKDEVSINKLTAYLKKLNYVYPYHQSIGFLLERSGVYPDSVVDLLRNFDFEYDFYLNYNMIQPEYSKRWRLYYPKGL